MPIKPVQSRIPPTASTSGAWLAERSDGHRLHAGVDLLGPEGGAVVAPESGVVVLTYESNRPRDPRRSVPAGWSGYGPKGVVMVGVSGAFHNLAHLGTIADGVVVGSTLAEGGAVGTISDLRHLHWEVRVRKQPIGGAAVVEIAADPALWLRGEWLLWEGQCPRLPVDDARTPRVCRPGWVGPPPPPFRRPRPTARLLQPPRSQTGQASHGPSGGSRGGGEGQSRG